MAHLTVDEILEFVSADKLSDEVMALSTKVNGHIRSCPSCLKTVTSFQLVYDKMSAEGHFTDMDRNFDRLAEADEHDLLR